MPQFITIGPCALRVPTLEQRLRRLCNKGLVPHHRVGSVRLFDVADLPAIRRICAEQGYSEPTAAEVAHAGR